MSESIVKIKVRLGANEAEIEAPISAIKEAIHLVPEVVQHLPKSVSAPILQTKSETVTEIPFKEGKVRGIPKILPEIKVEKDDSLPNVITKFFQDTWGRKTHKLNDVKNALESYGLIYPKQSVAVALLRLAKDGKLRRFKDESGEFVYTSSMSLTISNPSTFSRSVNSDKGGL
ncbi:MAG: hypothetical protein L6M37_02100 [Candidatus Methylarchaceae archaeon HK02M1]|nr:hypothetical protein [Candidatus Methylarchaceae archaeon HK01M]MCP8311729.1 hypothetical protein [Candidatus Methylarchaceae archaeon HK02M1]